MQELEEAASVGEPEVGRWTAGGPGADGGGARRWAVGCQHFDSGGVWCGVLDVFDGGMVCRLEEADSAGGQEKRRGGSLPASFCHLFAGWLIPERSSKPGTHKTSTHPPCRPP